MVVLTNTKTLVKLLRLTDRILKARSTGTVHTSAKARLTSAVIW